MSKKLHFGIIGAGRIGRVHAETLAFRLPEAEIAGHCGCESRGCAGPCRHVATFPAWPTSADEIFADQTLRRC